MKNDLPKVLHRGFDGLDISYTGCLPPRELEKLANAKEQAIKEMRPIPVKIGPGNFEILVAESGSKGGYKFRGDTGLFGETWFIKDRPQPEAGNIRISVKSLPLAVWGVDGIVARLSQKFAAMGANIQGESISRIDFAVDFLLPREFSIRPDQFSAHARARIDERGIAPQLSETGDGHFSANWSGRKITSITVGKMPGRQVIIYDKRREIIARQKIYWFNIWNIPRDDASIAVWRVEVRLGKQYLYDVVRLRTFGDMDRKVQAAMLDAMAAVRFLRSPRPKGNITRCPDHRLWKATRAEIDRCLVPRLPDVSPEEITEMEIQRMAAQRWRMIEGTMFGGLVAEGYSAAEAEQIAPFLLAEIGRQAARNPEEFAKRFAKAEERMRFLRSNPVGR